MEFTKSFTEISKNDVSIAGGKGASLGEMTQAGIPVPPGFVVIADAFERFAEETDLIQEITSILNTVNTEATHAVEDASEQIQGLILSKEIPEDIKKEILVAFKKLDTRYVAVRSSATSEDSADAAWAGQLDSFLNTTEDTLFENIRRCWASLFTPRAIFYRFEKKLQEQFISVAVVVQKMVNSEKSGIAFSVHPVTEDRNQIIIEAGLGLGEAIVSGSITPDSYVITKEPRKIIDINISSQSKALYRKEEGGNEWKELDKEGKVQVLTKDQILELTKLILDIENHYGFPCDIEWAYEQGRFYIVQSRPITTFSEISKETFSVFEKEWSREVAISTYYIWHYGHKKVFDFLKMDTFLAKKVFGIYENNQIETYTPLHNIETIKLYIKKVDNKRLSELLNDFKTQSERFYSDKTLIKDQNFSTNLSFLFILTFILGDIQEHSLQGKALSMRIEYESLFHDIEVSLLEYAPKPKYARLFTYQEIINKKLVDEEVLEKRKKSILEDKEIISFETISLEDFLLRQGLQIKTPIDSIFIENHLSFTRIFKKFFTREIPLYLIEYWYRGEYIILKKLINNATHFNPLFIRNNKGKISVYYDINNEETALYPLVLFIIRNAIIFNKYAEEYERSYRRMQELLRDPTIESLKELIPILDILYGFMPVLVQIGEFKDMALDQKLVERAIELRILSEKKDGEIEEYIKDIVKKYHPEFKTFTNVLKMSEITSGEFPNKKELQKRLEGFIFFEQQLLIDKDIKEIEKEFNVSVVDDLQVIGDTPTFEEKEKLRPTVKRDLSFLSVQAWQQGYGKFFERDFGWYYPIFFYYDREKVNFYHTLKDFEYFKNVITKRLLEEDSLFNDLNSNFQKNIASLNKIINSINDKTFEEAYDLAGNIMSFYIFIVSDDFVKARPEAWDSRHMSEGILYMLDAIFEEYVSSLLEKREYSVSLAHLLAKEEVLALVKKEAINIKNIEKRTQGYIFYNEELITDTSFSSFCSIHNFSNPEDELSQLAKEIKGIVSFKGKVQGKVRIVNRKEDINKINNRDILVSVMTNVNYLPAIKKASAMITDEGGITCHAAIVARELKIPCITGTKVATKVLKDGDLVEVDANNGVITILKNSAS